MARRNQPTTPTSSATISFKSIQLFKEETLGIGSYGKVCRAKCDNLPCAAKIIHETLFDPTDEQQMPRGREHRLPIRRFELECEFLNTIRHPNVIQYLGMYRDPDTGLPVLLMELMDDSLTHFLEAATQQIPYHVQVNISHDITMALTFLHANDIVHRDLSSNNVLLISNVRAKVTDFGMAKLGDINPRASRLTFTMCPGTDVYMPPEAVQDQPVYTEKIDCFSFGVIVIQMLTRQFPKPGDRQQRVEFNHPGLPRGTLMVCIPEVDRRQNHISQVDPNHTLLPISLNCLKDRDVERPSAQQLCERVAALKKQDKYFESVSATETSERDFQELLSQREQYTQQIHELQEQLQSQREQLTREIQAKDEAIQTQHRSLTNQHAREIQELLVASDEAIKTQHRSLTEQHAREMQELLAASDEAIIAKKHEIQDLIRSRDEARDKEIQQLREQLQQVTYEMTQRDQTMRNNRALPSDIKLRWRRRKSAPKRMYRRCDAAIGDGVVYFNVGGEKTMYFCSIHSELWSLLPDCPNIWCSLAVIDNHLTTIGGGHREHYSNKLYSLKQQAQRIQWVEEFPPMPTKRFFTTSICTKTALIVAGGESGGSRLTCVEVMNIETRQWSIAADMPGGMGCASRVICEDRLYVGGGDSNSVYSCSLSDLLQSCQSVSPTAQQRSSNTSSVWNKLTDLPEAIADGSTLLSLGGQLLAIGGRIDMFSTNPTKAVYIYKTTTNSWEVIIQMLVARSDCFAVTLPTNKVMVVGGVSDKGWATDTVEFADLI